MCVLTRYIHRNEFKKIIVMENKMKFYEWMRTKVQSVHLADNRGMAAAFDKID